MLLPILGILASLGPNPVIVISINKRLCSHSEGFSLRHNQTSWLGLCLLSTKQCLGPPFNQPACWDLREGFVPSGPLAAALVSPVSPPRFPGRQTLRHEEISPLLPSLALTVSLKACCFGLHLSVLGKLQDRRAV